MNKKEFIRRERLCMLLGAVWGFGCIVIFCWLSWAFQNAYFLFGTILAMLAFPIMDMFEPDMWEVEDD